MGRGGGGGRPGAGPDGLTKRGLHSAYHAARCTEQGVEDEVTHWHSRGGTYTIDYVFIPTDWTINEVEVGAEDPWRERSDHAPIAVDVDVEAS